MVLIGLILSCMDRRKNLAKQYEQKISQEFIDANQKPVKFHATISSAAAIEKAYDQNMTLLQYEPNHKVSCQYEELAEEFEERIALHFAEMNLDEKPVEETMQERVLANA